MDYIRKTKIIATLGPMTDSPEVMRELVKAGMNVARFNFSHGAHDEMRARLGLLRSVCAELGANVAALADTKGPEIRLGTFKGGAAELRAGDAFRLSTEPCEGDAGRAYVTYAGLPGDVSPGARILLDDGLIELRVTGVSGSEIVTEVVNGGPISDHKGVNVPSVTLRLPFLSDKDRADLRFIAEMGFDYIAASFTRDATDIAELRGEITRINGEREASGGEILIIAKIENADGVKNLDAIIEAADGVMVARGDLGVEMPLEDIPVLQKRMIRETRRLGKVVITATQMLESMIHNPRPTRAEVSDVANAIYDGTSAIMLSGETAAGRYPAEAVRTMAGIAAYTERAIDYRAAFRGGGREARFGASDPRSADAPRGADTSRGTDTSRGASDFGGESGQELSVVNAIAHATVTTAHDLGAAAILTVTMSGHTARNIAKFSPACPIIACSTDPAVVRRLALVWGVSPVLMGAQYDTGALFEQAAQLAKSRFGLAHGDLIVISAGVPLNVQGTTNMLKVHEIGDETKII